MVEPSSIRSTAKLGIVTSDDKYILFRRPLKQLSKNKEQFKGYI